MNTDEKLNYMIGCLQVVKEEMDHMAECAGLEPEDYKDSERCKKYRNYIKCTGMPNRFQRMSVTHPKHYRTCMNLENNGVKYKDALETCGICTETWEQLGQMSIEDFLGGTE